MDEGDEVTRAPIQSLADLAALSEAEMIEGYHDGRQNFPCGGNRSKDYWHGWRNGMVDGGHATADEAQRVLVAAFIGSKSLQSS